MSKKLRQSSIRLYELLLRFYPKDYKDEFGEEMKFVFMESLRDARASGKVTIFWIRIILDAGKSLFNQYLEEKKGGVSMKAKKNDLIMQNKIFIWILVAVGALLTIPLLGRFPWTLSDFVIMGLLLFFAGAVFVIAGRKFRPRKSRIIAAVVVGIVFLYVWAELAVGIFTNWGS